MRTSKILTLSALFLGTIVMMGGDCPFIPQVKTKLIELAVGGSTSMVFEADGTINSYDKTECISLNGDDLDIRGIILDAGIDPDSVSAIKFVGASRRVVRPEPGRTITDGTVTISRGLAGVPVTLVSGFFVDAGAVTDFVTEVLDPAGVALINAMLADILADIKAGGSTQIDACARIEGTSNPGAVNTDFDWELKIDISIVGTIELDTVDF